MILWHINFRKINEYIKTLTKTHTLNKEEIILLREFLSTNLDKKNLLRNKDVIYQKELGKLENIPNLHFNGTTRRFTLRKQHTQSNVKLGPTRKKKSRSNYKVAWVKWT